MVINKLNESGTKEMLDTIENELQPNQKPKNIISKKCFEFCNKINQVFNLKNISKTSGPIIKTLKLVKDRMNNIDLSIKDNINLTKNLFNFMFTKILNESELKKQKIKN